jgi:hypothetical protein
MHVTRHKAELQPSGPDGRVLGVAGLALSIGLISYYTVWVLIAPFIDGSERFFPPVEYAIAVPAVLFTTLVLGVATFIGLIMLRS